MNLVEYLRGDNAANDKRLRVRELSRYEPGNTVPPVNREADVHHLKSFETIAKVLKDTTAAMERNTENMVELDRVAAEERRRLDEERRDLIFKRNTHIDQLQQYIESTVEHGRLIIEPPPPPDPASLDVSFETPPALPQREIE